MTAIIFLFCILKVFSITDMQSVQLATVFLALHGVNIIVLGGPRGGIVLTPAPAACKLN